ncbi:hypothetical protein BD324DRAFT_136501 [Kockovaella imperatae]|uniref:Uncharacterized protein n=1 Tax=Kockovaella imperatae TaxID=4999 RepID=A0A1Y1U9X4_9TREE|nr:hypothetical protein BD324DRAFT_136501 [Kockovaella imperatae]ORX34828.1 hypothetical protein BD324DRAFT_136501 [Kockovaella imperatae]
MNLPMNPLCLWCLSHLHSSSFRFISSHLENNCIFFNETHSTRDDDDKFPLVGPFRKIIRTTRNPYSSCHISLSLWPYRLCAPMQWPLRPSFKSFSSASIPGSQPLAISLFLSLYLRSFILPILLIFFSLSPLDPYPPLGSLVGFLFSNERSRTLHIRTHISLLSNTLHTFYVTS